MYLGYWRLQEEPFSNALDERFFFKTPQHDEAIARLLYAVRQRKNGTILTGGYGSGKSLVRRIFLQRLSELGTFQVAQVDNPLLPATDILLDVASQMDRRNTSRLEGWEALRGISAALLAKQREGGHGIVLVEEAQLLSDFDRLEQLRLLMNLEDPRGRSLLTLVLIGAPALLQHVAKSPSLQQCVSGSWVLEPLARDQTREYINYRLQVAGGNGWIFDDGAIDVLHEYSLGTPRIINHVADLALYLAMVESAVQVDTTITQRVITDLQRNNALWQAEEGG